jgi:hypothetical protein
MAPLKTPTVVQQVVEQVSADTWEAVGLTIHIIDSASITVSYRFGVADSDGIVEWRGDSEFIIDAASLVSQFPDGSKTWHDNLKALVYTLGQAQGHFPAAGVVS